MLSGIIGTKNLGKTWMVADINIPDISFVSRKKDDYVFDKQSVIINEFRRLIIEAMQLPLAEIASIPIEGAIEGSEVSIFTLQQNISEVAFAGNNVILIGDAVGNGHWSVGGGMQIGAICHVERLKRYKYGNPIGDSVTKIF